MESVRAMEFPIPSKAKTLGNEIGPYGLVWAMSLMFKFDTRLTRTLKQGTLEPVPIFTVELSKSARKDLSKVPAYIVDKLDTWIDAVERSGLEQVRKVPGYHDEPLQGKRWGQRSIRLSLHYRAIYRILADHSIEFAQVEEVNKHEY